MKKKLQKWFKKIPIKKIRSLVKKFISIIKKKFKKFLRDANIGKLVSTSIFILLVILMILSITDVISLSVITKEDKENESIVYVDNNKLRGTIFDKNCIPLVYTKIDSEKNYYREVKSKYTFAVSPLVSQYGSQNTLEVIYDEELRKNNPTHVNDSDSVGRSIITTIDADLENEIYKLFNDSKNSIFRTGNVIMITDQEIPVCISSPSFDSNDFRKNAETRLKLADSPKLLNRTLEKYPFKSKNAKLDKTNVTYDFGEEMNNFCTDGASCIRLATAAYNAGTGSKSVPRMIIGTTDTREPTNLIEQIPFSSAMPMDKVKLSRKESIKVGDYSAYIDTSNTDGVYTVYGYFENNSKNIFSLAVNIIDSDYDYINNEDDAVNFFADIAKICIKTL